ncbi:hypothetical protein SAMN04488063_0803 [Halopelagius inordinatus]|uniref:DUF7344 domain-containing protein n=1 Tax=Halopelagius inordinatus TaxID=553467 RepID=A0A1I2MRM6_9EURY|nr:hypothetical protein [Halopelagius inordinatus]SFF92127.1 hypothetical protein SAMN04488063_0803 [Halopelagius inordinatus]
MDKEARALGALANARRLLVLLSLKENETPMSLDALATDVAMRETDFPDEDLSDDHIDSVLLSLHHVHIPKLVSEDIVAFHEDEDHVALTADIHDIERILNAVFDD